MHKSILYWIAFVLLIVGGLNWGLVGLFNFDVVAVLFGSIPMVAQVVYVLVGLAAVWFIVYKLMKKKRK
jgi:hypothetical protein